MTKTTNTLLTILITVIIVGVGVYFWQQKSNEQPHTEETEIIAENETAETVKELKTETTQEDPNKNEFDQYSDADLSFQHPKTWTVTRARNFISIFTGDESPVYEGNAGTYSLEIFYNLNDAKKNHAELEFWNQGPKNGCVPQQNLKLDGYSVCKFEQEISSIDGVSTVYKLTPTNQTPPWVFIYANSDNDSVVKELLTNLRIK